MVKAVIFDCFGVLMVRSIDSFIDAHPAVSTELYDIDKQANLGYIDQRDQIRQYCSITGESAEKVRSYILNEHILNDPLVRSIKELKPNYKVAMLSNVGPDWYKQVVPESIRELFDETILSSEVGMMKPYPEIFKLAISKFGLNPNEMLFVDDLLDNCDGAKSVGMHAIHYQNLNQFEVELFSYMHK